MGEALKLGLELARLAFDVIDGMVSPEEAHRKVRDILPDESASERAAKDIEAARRLERLADLDGPDEGAQ